MTMADHPVGAATEPTVPIFEPAKSAPPKGAFLTNCGGATKQETPVKQKEVLAETDASHVSLHNFFGLRKANHANIARLLLASLIIKQTSSDRRRKKKHQHRRRPERGQ
jgi:hypothetical protein